MRCFYFNLPVSVKRKYENPISFLREKIYNQVSKISVFYTACFIREAEEQVIRLKRDGINPFKHDDYYSFNKSEKQIFIEYARAMQRGCVWTEDRLKYGESL